MFWPVTKALLGHYKRYPFQILLVWLGLTLGVSLLVGVTAINHHAKQSYEHGEKLFSNPLPYRIRPKHITNTIPQGFYVQLRRDGFNQCSPFKSLRLQMSNGADLVLVGVDPVAMLPLNQDKMLSDFSLLKLLKKPYPIIVSADLAIHMRWKDHDFIDLADGTRIGPIVIDEYNKLGGTRLIADISKLRTLDKRSGISEIACGNMPPKKLAKLKQYLPDGIALTRNTRTELESLTQAFHMNLTAMGMLAFLVGLFIFYQAMSLSLTQRQPLVGAMRQAGVSGWQLAQALSLELVVFVLVSWLSGNFFGLLLANQLIPTVSASLNSLYDANVGLLISWSWQTSIYSFALTILAAFAACAWPLVRLLRAQPIRLSAHLSLVRFSGKEFAIQALLACALCVVGIAIYQAPQTQGAGFAIIVLMLLSVALLTPFLIWKVFDSLSFSLKWVKVRWFFADAGASMSYRGVATMAFMLAMAANIGVETMVGSFRDTTDKWLNQRLAADMYIYPNNSAAARMSTWLTKQEEVDSVWWRWEREVNINKDVLQVVSTGSSQGELDALTVKLGIPNYWYHLHHSKGVMISESMALKLNIRPGDNLDLPVGIGPGWLVVGVYYDYGNPYNQVLLSHRNWLFTSSGSGSVMLGTVFKPDANVSALKQKMLTVFRLNPERVFDNDEIHKQAMKIFDRTFSIASKLGNITLLIAVFGLFFATVAGEVSRQKHVSLLRCLGMSGKELVAMAGLQLFILGLISVLIALPLGLALANIVVDIVIRQSFGWTLELQVIPGEYLQSGLLAMFSLMLAGGLPVLRTIRSAPMKSMRDAL
ncbi:FtsX-like permease family protein [Vibrio ostreicida]|uniref:ABC transporter permease n=1 Tax=Vibrio ostreicida TaxID=526588 RepID=A0ABT8BU14_9VIBR|nr:ABC transporter permease [Vibrio ostreicida]MDN3609861.1 ABC transporter permease [Vibrio ostreicida]NPD09983.1 FtsX-like permease family protein [Vibrio ostreicida]